MIEIRNLTPQSVGEAVAIDEAVFPESPWGRESFLENIGNSFDHPLIAYADGVPAGFGILRKLDDGEVLLIGVLPAHRRKGIGAQLLDQMLRISGPDAKVFLEVRESNLPARALYESRGFREISRRKNYYADPVEDAVIMTG